MAAQQTPEKETKQAEPQKKLLSEPNIAPGIFSSGFIATIKGVWSRICTIFHFLISFPLLGFKAITQFTTGTTSKLFVLTICSMAMCAIIPEGITNTYVKRAADFTISLAPNLFSGLIFFMLVEEGLKHLYGFEFQRRRSPWDIIRLIKKAPESQSMTIDILDINASEVLDHKENAVDPVGAVFCDAIEKAIRGNCDVRLLLANPDSQPTRQRSRERAIMQKKKMTPVEYRAKCIRDIQLLADFRNGLKPKEVRDRFKIKLYTVTPSICYYRLGDAAYCALYSPGRITEDSRNLLVGLHSEFMLNLQSHFTDVWGNSSSVGIDSYTTAAIDLGEDAFEVTYTNAFLDVTNQANNGRRMGWEDNFPISFWPGELVAKQPGTLKYIQSTQQKTKLLKLRDKSLQFRNIKVKAVIEHILYPVNDDGFTEAAYKPLWDNIRKEIPWAIQETTADPIVILSRAGYSLACHGFFHSNSPDIAFLLQKPWFVDSWNRLSIDFNYNNGMHGSRKRAIAKYDLVWDRDIISSLTLREKDTSFYQSMEVNLAFGGNQRNFDPCESPVQEHVKDIIKHDFIRFISSISGPISPKWLVTVHQIRVLCPIGGEKADPVPEGIHRDGHRFVVIHVVKRHNLDKDSGISRVYKTFPQKDPDFEAILQPFDSLFLDDSAVLHYVSNLVRCKSGFEEPSDKAYRDVLIVDFDVIEHHSLNVDSGVVYLPDYEI